MNLLLLIIAVFTVFSPVFCVLKTFRFIPFCNYTFKYDENEINGFFRMEMTSGYSTNGAKNFKLGNRNESSLKYFSYIKKPIGNDEDNVEDQIRKFIARRALLDQGFIAKEVVDYDFLEFGLAHIKFKKGESLVFSDTNQYYKIKLLNLIHFKVCKDKKTGKFSGVDALYHIFVPGFSMNYRPNEEDCKEELYELPKFFKDNFRPFPIEKNCYN